MSAIDFNMKINHNRNPLLMMDNVALTSLSEIMDVIKKGAMDSFERQRSSKGRSTGTLISSFGEVPITQAGDKIYKGIVFAGGPKAPYAPIVEFVGWQTKEGRKPPYRFMEEGAKEGAEKAPHIVTQNFSTIKSR